MFKVFIAELILSILIILFIVLPSLLVSIQLFISQQKKIDCTLTSNSIREGCAIIIPAHNEELVIEETIKMLLLEITEKDRIVVVADNCSDTTAKICSNFPIEVLERSNDEEIGKGYALDHAIQYLKTKPPTTVVIFDADCQFRLGSLDTLVSRSQNTLSTVQAMYLMKAKEGAEIKTRIAEFAWLVKNRFRATGMFRLGYNCQLQGSGMAFPWKVFDKISLASGSIVEDLELGLKLANLNEKILYEENALVTSFFPDSDAGKDSQRVRWEHGHLTVIKPLPKMMFKATINRKSSVFWPAMDAAVPPTVLWLLIVFFATLASTILLLLNITIPIVLLSACLLLLTLGLCVTWLNHGKKLIPVKDVFGIVLYVFSKFSIYKRFIISKQTTWIRTDREKNTSSNDTTKRN